MDSLKLAISGFINYLSLQPTTKRIYRFLFRQILGPYLISDLSEDSINIHIENGIVELHNLKLNVKKLNELLPRRRRNSPDSQDSSSHSQKQKGDDEMENNNNGFDDFDQEKGNETKWIESLLKSYLENATELIKEDTSLLQIIDGTIGKAKLDIPWDRFLDDPVTLTIEGLDLKIVPYNMDDVDRELTDDSITTLSNIRHMNDTHSFKQEGRLKRETEKKVFMSSNENKFCIQNENITNDTEDEEDEEDVEDHNQDGDEDGIGLSFIKTYIDEIKERLKFQMLNTTITLYPHHEKKRETEENPLHPLHPNNLSFSVKSNEGKNPSLLPVIDADDWKAPLSLQIHVESVTLEDRRYNTAHPMMKNVLLKKITCSLHVNIIKTKRRRNFNMKNLFEPDYDENSGRRIKNNCLMLSYPILTIPGECEIDVKKLAHLSIYTRTRSSLNIQASPEIVYYMSMFHSTSSLIQEYIYQARFAKYILTQIGMYDRDHTYRFLYGDISNSKSSSNDGTSLNFPRTRKDYIIHYFNSFRSTRVSILSQSNESISDFDRLSSDSTNHDSFQKLDGTKSNSVSSNTSSQRRQHIHGIKSMTDEQLERSIEQALTEETCRKLSANERASLIVGLEEYHRRKKRASMQNSVYSLQNSPQHNADKFFDLNESIFIDSYTSCYHSLPHMAESGLGRSLFADSYQRTGSPLEKSTDMRKNMQAQFEAHFKAIFITFFSTIQPSVEKHLTQNECNLHLNYGHRSLENLQQIVLSIEELFVVSRHFDYNSENRTGLQNGGSISTSDNSTIGSRPKMEFELEVQKSFEMIERRSVTEDRVIETKLINFVNIEELIEEEGKEEDQYWDKLEMRAKETLSKTEVENTSTEEKNTKGDVQEEEQSSNVIIMGEYKPNAPYIYIKYPRDDIVQILEDRLHSMDKKKKEKNLQQEIPNDEDSTAAMAASLADLSLDRSLFLNPKDPKLLKAMPRNEKSASTTQNPNVTDVLREEVEIKMEGIELTLSLSMVQEWIKVCSIEKLFHIDQSESGKKHGLYEERERTFKFVLSSSSLFTQSEETKEETVGIKSHNIRQNVDGDSNGKDEPISLPAKLRNTSLNDNHFSIWNIESKRNQEKERERLENEAKEKQRRKEENKRALFNSLPLKQELSGIFFSCPAIICYFPSKSLPPQFSAFGERDHVRDSCLKKEKKKAVGSTNYLKHILHKQVLNEHKRALEETPDEDDEELTQKKENNDNRNDNIQSLLYPFDSYSHESKRWISGISTQSMTDDKEMNRNIFKKNIPNAEESNFSSKEGLEVRFLEFSAIITAKARTQPVDSTMLDSDDKIELSSSIPFYASFERALIDIRLLTHSTEGPTFYHKLRFLDVYSPIDSKVASNVGRCHTVTSKKVSFDENNLMSHEEKFRGSQNRAQSASITNERLRHYIRFSPQAIQREILDAMSCRSFISLQNGKGAGSANELKNTEASRSSQKDRQKNTNKKVAESEYSQIHENLSGRETFLHLHLSEASVDVTHLEKSVFLELLENVLANQTQVSDKESLATESNIDQETIKDEEKKSLPVRVTSAAFSLVLHDSLALDYSSPENAKEMGDSNFQQNREYDWLPSNSSATGEFSPLPPKALLMEHHRFMLIINDFELAHDANLLESTAHRDFSSKENASGLSGGDNILSMYRTSIKAGSASLFQQEILPSISIGNTIASYFGSSPQKTNNEQDHKLDCEDCYRTEFYPLHFFALSTCPTIREKYHTYIASDLVEKQKKSSESAPSSKYESIWRKINLGKGKEIEAVLYRTIWGKQVVPSDKLSNRYKGQKDVNRSVDLEQMYTYNVEEGDREKVFGPNAHIGTGKPGVKRAGETNLFRLQFEAGLRKRLKYYQSSDKFFCGFDPIREQEETYPKDKVEQPMITLNMKSKSSIVYSDSLSSAVKRPSEEMNNKSSVDRIKSKSNELKTKTNLEIKLHFNEVVHRIGNVTPRTPQWINKMTRLFSSNAFEFLPQEYLTNEGCQRSTSSIEVSNNNSGTMSEPRNEVEEKHSENENETRTQALITLQDSAFDLLLPSRSRVIFLISSVGASTTLVPGAPIQRYKLRFGPDETHAKTQDVSLLLPDFHVSVYVADLPISYRSLEDEYILGSHVLKCCSSPQQASLLSRNRLRGSRSIDGPLRHDSVAPSYLVMPLVTQPLSPVQYLELCGFVPLITINHIEINFKFYTGELTDMLGEAILNDKQKDNVDMDIQDDTLMQLEMQIPQKAQKDYPYRYKNPLQPPELDVELAVDQLNIHACSDSLRTLLESAQTWIWDLEATQLLKEIRSKQKLKLWMNTWDRYYRICTYTYNPKIDNVSQRNNSYPPSISTSRTPLSTQYKKNDGLNEKISEPKTLDETSNTNTSNESINNPSVLENYYSIRRDSDRDGSEDNTSENRNVKKRPRKKKRRNEDEDNLSRLQKKNMILNAPLISEHLESSEDEEPVPGDRQNPDIIRNENTEEKEEDILQQECLPNESPGKNSHESSLTYERDGTSEDDEDDLDQGYEEDLELKKCAKREIGSNDQNQNLELLEMSFIIQRGEESDDCKQTLIESDDEIEQIDGNDHSAAELLSRQKRILGDDVEESGENESENAPDVEEDFALETIVNEDGENQVEEKEELDIEKEREEEKVKELLESFDTLDDIDEFFYLHKKDYPKTEGGGWKQFPTETTVKQYYIPRQQQKKVPKKETIQKVKTRFNLKNINIRCRLYEGYDFPQVKLDESTWVHIQVKEEEDKKKGGNINNERQAKVDLNQPTKVKGNNERKDHKNQEQEQSSKNKKIRKNSDDFVNDFVKVSTKYESRYGKSTYKRRKSYRNTKSYLDIQFQNMFLVFHTHRYMQPLSKQFVMGIKHFRIVQCRPLEDPTMSRQEIVLDYWVDDIRHPRTASGAKSNQLNLKMDWLNHEYRKRVHEKNQIITGKMKFTEEDNEEEDDDEDITFTSKGSLQFSELSLPSKNGRVGEVGSVSVSVGTNRSRSNSINIRNQHPSSVLPTFTNGNNIVKGNEDKEGFVFSSTNELTTNNSHDHLDTSGEPQSFEQAENFDFNHPKQLQQMHEDSIDRELDTSDGDGILDETEVDTVQMRVLLLPLRVYLEPATLSFLKDFFLDGTNKSSYAVKGMKWELKAIQREESDLFIELLQSLLLHCDREFMYSYDQNNNLLPSLASSNNKTYLYPSFRPSYHHLTRNLLSTSSSSKSPSDVEKEVTSISASVSDDDNFSSLACSPLRNRRIITKDPRADRSNTSTVTQSGKDESVLFFDKLEIREIKIKIDYIPASIDRESIRKGDMIEVCKYLFTNLNGVELILNSISEQKINGADKALQIISNAYCSDILNKQLFNIAKGSAPIKSICNIGIDVADLIMVPFQQNGKDKSLTRLMKRGTLKCVKGVTREALSAGYFMTRLVSSTFQSVAKNYTSVIGGNSMSTYPYRSPSQTHDVMFANVNPMPLSGVADKISKYTANQINSFHIREQNRLREIPRQPTGLRDAMDTAYNSLATNIGTAAHTVIAIPIIEYEKRGVNGAVQAVVKALPIAICSSVVGVSDALSVTLLGLRNTVDPSFRIEEESRVVGLTRDRMKKSRFTSSGDKPHYNDGQIESGESRQNNYGHTSTTYYH